MARGFSNLRLDCSRAHQPESSLGNVQSENYSHCYLWHDWQGPPGSSTSNKWSISRAHLLQNKRALHRCCSPTTGSSLTASWRCVFQLLNTFNIYWDHWRLKYAKAPALQMANSTNEQQSCDAYLLFDLLFDLITIYHIIDLNDGSLPFHRQTNG